MVRLDVVRWDLARFGLDYLINFSIGLARLGMVRLGLTG